MLWAIGDIHGCLTAFETLLDAIQLQPGDQIVALGDYVDRGPDSKRVLDRLILLHEPGQLIPLIGNHEIMMLAAREDWKAEEYWLSYGGTQTLASYAPVDRKGRLNDVPDKHWRFMATNCLPHHQTESHIFVHAGLHPQYDLESQPDEELYWQSLTNRGPHVSGKIIVCGHTVQRGGRPTNWGHTIAIDTGAYDGGWLTALNVETNLYWQANQQGETRTGQI